MTEQVSACSKQRLPVRFDNEIVEAARDYIYPATDYLPSIASRPLICFKLWGNIKTCRVFRLVIECPRMLKWAWRTSGIERNQVIFKSHWLGRDYHRPFHARLRREIYALI